MVFRAGQVNDSFGLGMHVALSFSPFTPVALSDRCTGWDRWLEVWRQRASTCVSPPRPPSHSWVKGRKGGEGTPNREDLKRRGKSSRSGSWQHGTATTATTTTNTSTRTTATPPSLHRNNWWPCYHHNHNTTTTIIPATQTAIDKRITAIITATQPPQ